MNPCKPVCVINTEAVGVIFSCYVSHTFSRFCVFWANIKEYNFDTQNIDITNIIGISGDKAIIA